MSSAVGTEQHPPTEPDEAPDSARWRETLREIASGGVMVGFLAVLLAVLVGAHELLAQGVVDRGIGAAARRARERDRARAHPLAADEQLGARAQERGVAGAGGGSAPARSTPARSTSATSASWSTEPEAATTTLRGT